MLEKYIFFFDKFWNKVLGFLKGSSNNMDRASQTGPKMTQALSKEMNGLKKPNSPAFFFILKQRSLEGLIYKQKPNACFVIRRSEWVIYKQNSLNFFFY